HLYRQAACARPGRPRRPDFAEICRIRRRSRTLTWYWNTFMTQAPVGILGGTFDPIHNGHLRLAMELVACLSLDHVRLIPNGRPPHRDAPGAAPGQRAKWIRLAVANEPRLRLDDRELLRDGPSYMVDTLGSLRAELCAQPLCLVMGRDVFAKLPEWHDWRRLFDLAHIVLINRPEVTI